MAYTRKVSTRKRRCEVKEKSTGDLIGVFESVAAAARATNINYNLVHNIIVKGKPNYTPYYFEVLDPQSPVKEPGAWVGRIGKGYGAQTLGAPKSMKNAPVQPCAQPCAEHGAHCMFNPNPPPKPPAAPVARKPRKPRDQNAPRKPRKARVKAPEVVQAPMFVASGDAFAKVAEAAGRALTREDIGSVGVSLGDGYVVVPAPVKMQVQVSRASMLKVLAQQAWAFLVRAARKVRDMAAKLF